ncbi:Protein of unknown function [Pyronema omphalodes CBS 100304]|uniref:Uncharacterized protein n=1 Tax=Pyronema omphalodes (strain CBS 100304) TaxID=1076935 RepID=U4L5U5_PYROM|nr:Protein of unknown function [Pyronema omphalodes CBS 100304]
MDAAAVIPYGPYVPWGSLGFGHLRESRFCDLETEPDWVQFRLLGCSTLKMCYPLAGAGAGRPIPTPFL